ncbi:glycosyltransferase family 4 protein [Siphonobacter sp. SORGH_AS_0500]|uniref:glycosyltransferase family 4 protein n=1 Tax=Siphonobacter sp. SORGH_AS_0500 TaxID=1864824 RepID=UPI002862F41B|nr:glycosyltransferase family 4 protein [Siphonobacter sp. SORGH_AS_0500]MDR6193342.1 glycosyltransferase involved in cell wall biosynthesis [Siphonobacter sp. SORGH_AS_0500]
MRIAIFIEGEFIPSYSGASNRFHYLSRHLQELLDVEIIIILCDRGWYDIDRIKKEKFTTYILHPSDFYNKSEVLKRILLIEKPDILQFANLENAIFQGIPLSLELNTYLVFESHFDDIEFGKSIGVSNKRLDKLSKLSSVFGKSFDTVIALSSDDVIQIAERLEILKESISIIPSGADIFDFSANLSNINNKKAVFLGNMFFQPNANSVYQIKDVISPQIPEFNFYICGDVPNQMRRFIESEKFVFTGKVENLNLVFKESTIALAPITGGAGMRIKILNYLLAGIPVITTSDGARGFPDKSLLIVEDDLDKYGTIIKNLVNDYELYQQYSIQGRDYILKNLSWQKVAIKVHDIYKCVLLKPRIDKKLFDPKLFSFVQEDPTWLEEANSKMKNYNAINSINNYTYLLIRNENVYEY